MKNLRELNEKELYELKGGCFAFDFGYALQWLGNAMLPGGGNTDGLEAAYPYGDAQHEH